MLAALVAHRRTATNVALARSQPELEIMLPAEALRRLRPGDIAIGRLDVSQHLDGVEAGLWELARLEGSGVRVLNRPRALLAAHDKLATSRALAASGVPHPQTVLVPSVAAVIPLEPPLVLKPRFGSWGRDVVLCEDQRAIRRHLGELAHRRWFKSHGALAQELIPPQGEDLRVVVARGSVVGCVRRVAAPGEWRTNVALGATRHPATPTPEACRLALAAARTLEADLVGVDLLPTPEGGYIVIEVNGAVEFTSDYTLNGDIFERTSTALLGDRVAAVA